MAQSITADTTERPCASIHTKAQSDHCSECVYRSSNVQRCAQGGLQEMRNEVRDVRLQDQVVACDVSGAGSVSCHGEQLMKRHSSSETVFRDARWVERRQRLENLEIWNVSVFLRATVSPKANEAVWVL